MKALSRISLWKIQNYPVNRTRVQGLNPSNNKLIVFIVLFLYIMVTRSLARLSLAPLCLATLGAPLPGHHVSSQAILIMPSPSWSSPPCHPVCLSTPLHLSNIANWVGASCGTGVMVRNVTCVVQPGNRPVDPSHCDQVAGIRRVLIFNSVLITFPGGRGFDGEGGQC